MDYKLIMITKKCFKKMCTMLANTYGFDESKIKFYVECNDMSSPTMLSSKEFIESVKQYDKQMAIKIEAWLKASNDMGNYVRSRCEGDVSNENYND